MPKDGTQTLLKTDILFGFCQADVSPCILFSPGCIQQSSLSPQGQLLVPQTRDPAHSELLSQSPSPSLHTPLLQQSSFPIVCQVVSGLILHGAKEEDKAILEWTSNQISTNCIQYPDLQKVIKSIKLSLANDFNYQNHEIYIKLTFSSVGTLVGNGCHTNSEATEDGDRPHAVLDDALEMEGAT